MTASSTQWWPVLLVLAVGSGIGAWLVWRLRTGAAPLVPAVPLELRDLLGRRDALLQQLRELHELPDGTSAPQRAERRRALELEAARVLLDIEDNEPVPAADATPVAPVAAAPAAAAPAPSGSAVAGFAWGLGTAGAFAALLYFASGQAQPRPEGGSVTGGFGPTTAAPETAAAGSAGSAEAALERAKAALQQQDMMTVWKESQEALRIAPGHPQALSYLSLVRLAMGQPEIAEQLLEQAIREHPDFAEGYVHLALVYERSGRPAEADRIIGDAVARFPQDAELIRRAATEIRRVSAQAPEKAAPGPDPHAGLPVTPDPHAGLPVTPGPPAVARVAAGPDGVAGTVELAGALPPGAVLFVTARPVGQQGGPPIAVKRLTPRVFPVVFSLGPADSMMGQALPPRLRLEARLDSDGDPLSRPPTDPTALLEDVALGSSGLKLQLGAR